MLNCMALWNKFLFSSTFWNNYHRFSPPNHFYQENSELNAHHEILEIFSIFGHCLQGITNE